MSEKKAMAASKGRRFSEEFQQDAVRLVTKEKYSVAAAATAVGVCEKTLRKWIDKWAGTGGEDSLRELRAENQRLRRELRRAEMEREILKKAAAYFAKESQ